MTGAGSLSPSPQPVTANPVRTLTLGGRCGVSPQKGVCRQRSADQGEGFPPQDRKTVEAYKCKSIDTDRRKSRRTASLEIAPVPPYLAIHVQRL